MLLTHTSSLFSRSTCRRSASRSGPGGGGPLSHALRLGDRRRRPATFLQIPPRAAVDVRLPVQLGRPLKVALPMGLVAPFGQAAAIDAFFTASLFERQIRRRLPRLVGLLEPLLRRGGAGFR